MIRAMADDEHDRVGGKGVRDPQNMFDERESRCAVQDLGQVRLHPRALAGREHDDVDPGGVWHGLEVLTWKNVHQTSEAGAARVEAQPR